MNKFKDLIHRQRENKPVKKWEGTCLEYMELVQENPEISTTAPGRIYNMIMKYGTNDVPDELKTRSYEDLVEYKFFDGKIFGTREPIHDLMRFLKASSRRTETGKRILVMVGPVSSGKSTIASLIKKGIEKDDVPTYCIKGCPLHEDPFHLIPEEDREFWNEQLGVRIDGHLCPKCQFMVDNEYTDEDGKIHWENVPVEMFNFSEQKRVGIGTFQPSDTKSQDITELIGRVNTSKMSRYGETDPRAYDFDGELHIANRGLLEYIEILKADVKFHYVLITVAQEQMIKSPGFPHTYVDTLVLSHTNETEFDIFKGKKENEALHDRMYPIFVPWNLRINDEIKIYEKMIKESKFNKIHIAPNTLKTAAMFAVISRLKDSNKVGSKIKKMKLYNGEIPTEFKKEEIDIKGLIQEGRDKKEGRSGISPRFVINALNVALATKEDKSCINSIDVIRALKNNFDHHIGITEEEKNDFINLLIAEKESVTSEFKDITKKEVNMAFLHAYDEQANTMFDNYMRNISAFCAKEKVYDSITGEYENPNEDLMRSIENLIGVPENAKSEFRNSIFVHKTRCLENKENFTYDKYPPLKDAIEKKLMSDLKNVVSLSLTDKTGVNEKSKKQKNRAFENLKKRGYCDQCANVTLSFIGEILRKEG